MSTRSLTEVFVLMRNNSVQNRNIYSEQRMTDTVALVNYEEDFELGRIAPSWTTAVEETQYSAVRLKSKLATLADLHMKAISRPTLDDSTHDEKQIEVLSQEISRMFGSSHRLINQIKTEASYTKSTKERCLANSVTMALVTSLQDLSMEFRQLQTNYFNKLNSREERSRAYFEIDLGPSAIEDDVLPEKSCDWSDQTTIADDRSLQSLLLSERKSFEAALREKEVKYLVDSILELNDLFKDLSQLIVDQGTVLDRIDYNLERTAVEVTHGAGELQKAARYHRGNRKAVCIVALAATTTLMTALLIISKT